MTCTYREIFLPHHASIHENNGYAQLNEQPDNNVNRLCSLEQFLSVLYAQHGLRHHDSSIHPTLCTDPFAACVCDIYVVLTNWRRHKQSHKHQPNDYDWVWRRHFEYVFQEECVQFGHLPEDNQLTHSQKSHVRGLRIQPSDVSKTSRCELEHCSFNFTACRRYVSDGRIEFVRKTICSPAKMENTAI